MASISIVAIGSELLSGRVVDTNSAYLGQNFLDLGAQLKRVFTVDDSIPEIVWALEEAVAAHDVVIVSGGLGPTSDDVTRDGIAKFCGVELVEDAASRQRLFDRYARRNIPMNTTSPRQCLFPRGSEVLPNPVGTADAFRCTVEKGGRKRFIISLPGVPHELRALFEKVVAPWLLETFSDLSPPARSFLQCFGLSESYLGTRIEEIGVGEDVDVGYRPVFPEVWITLRSGRRSPADMERVAATLADGIGCEFVYSRTENVGLSETLGALLLERKLTIACAESCSGGAAADRLVSCPGASAYFLGSAVTYSNSAKAEVAGVPETLISRYGAVSAEVAAELAAGARKKFGSDIGISTTGVAGPEGGTPEKPVGTVYFGISDEKGTEVVHRVLPYDRNHFRPYCAVNALDIVRRRLLGFPLSWERK